MANFCAQCGKPIDGGEISEMTEALGELSQIEEELKKIENSGVLENVTNGQKF